MPPATPATAAHQHDPVTHRARGGREVAQEPIPTPGHLQPGHHICLLYDTPGEQQAFLTAFFRAGLDRGEQCVYIADEHTPQEVLAFLEAGGVDAAKAQAEGRLAVVTKRETYLRDGSFDPDTMIGFVRQTVEATRKAGHPAARVTGEMTWALGTEPGLDRIVEYEAKINEVFRDRGLVAVCQYNRAKFPPGLLIEILETHPVVVVGGEVCRNVYYVPPEESLRGNRDGVALQRLVENLQAREAQERERVEAALRAEELRRLRDLEQIRADFVRAAAHELGNPLTPLQIQVSLLKTRHAEGLSPKQREAVGVIERNVDRLTALIQDLLEVTRLQAGQLRIEATTTDLHGAVLDTVESFQEVARSRGVALQASSAQGLLVTGDPRRLTQVLFNLVGNAVKFTPAGGTVVVEAARLPGGGARVEVRDTGPGIAAEDLHRLFQPFTRLARSGKADGTGLGLYISKGLVELHGGRIAVASDGPGRGARFTVELPGPARPGALRLP